MVGKGRREPLELDLKYRKIRDINAGSFGFVQEARNLRSGEHVAIKFIPRGRYINKYVAREIVNHSHLLHPHIVQFKEVFLTADYLAIAMEYVAGGDMFAYVKRRGGLEEDEARWFFQQLIMALAYSHEIGVVNRDIKLENTLLNNGKRPLLKICDFGYSKNDKDSLPKSKVGTPGYTAPEVMFYNKRFYDGKKADVWSSGVMLYVMLFCTYPFGLPEDPHSRPDALAEFRERVEHGQLSFPDEIPVSSHAKHLLQHMLQREPEQRATVAQVRAHAWCAQDLPPGVAHMNQECLQLRGNTAGHQTHEEIEHIVQQAMAEPPEFDFGAYDLPDQEQELW